MAILSHSPRGSVDWNQCLQLLIEITPLSLPSWECGLKYIKKEWYWCHQLVTPLVGVWIEISSKKKVTHANICHSPRGSVDWNSSVISATTKAVVTPLVGVWIEIVQM